MASRVPTVQEDGTFKEKMLPTYLRSTQFNDALQTTQTAAEDNASTDAQTKADAAYDSAVSTAAADATTKANNARDAAISAAATDATNKANAAAGASVPLASKGQASGVPANDAAHNTVVGLDGTWNGGHLVMGTYHFWVDANADLRMADHAPTSDSDGVAVGDQVTGP